MYWLIVDAGTEFWFPVQWPVWQPGESQIMEIITAIQMQYLLRVKTSGWRWKTCWRPRRIVKWAARQRCGWLRKLDLLTSPPALLAVGDGYLAWLDNTLQIRETANENIRTLTHDFRGFGDDPAETPGNWLLKEQDRWPSITPGLPVICRPWPNGQKIPRWRRYFRFSRIIIQLWNGTWRKTVHGLSEKFHQWDRLHSHVRVWRWITLALIRARSLSV